ncbi:MAG: hypothetical protein ABL864_14035 [Terricaulis sp.]
MATDDELPIEHNLRIWRGDTWARLQLTYTDALGDPIDVSDRSWSAQIKRNPEDTTAAAEIDFDITDAANGVVPMSIPAATTAAMTPGLYVWDCQETGASGAVTTIVAGAVTVRSDTTR